MKKPVILLYSLLLLGLIFLPTYIFGTDVFKVNAQQRLAAAAFTHKDEVDPCVETSSAVSIFKTVSQQPSEFREALDYALVFITKRNV